MIGRSESKKQPAASGRAGLEPTRRDFVRLAALGTIGSLLGLPGCSSKSEAKPAAGRPFHHLNGGFRNPPGSPVRNAPLSVRLAFFSRLIAELSGDPPTPPRGHVLDRGEALAQLAAHEGRESVTWLGHSTFLIRLRGQSILTDPFLSEYASPIAGYGPRRYVPPGVPLDKLPPIDVVVLSHNHYDHLDLPTLEALPARERITAVVPLRLGGYFRERGYGRVVELDWHQSVRLGRVTITALPAIHFSRRGLFDGDETLWAGFALSGGNRKIYFSGDTGYGPVFKELGGYYGPFDLGLVTIGAYQPREIMHASHVTPEEAVKIGRDLGLKAMAGMHWGTVLLAEEPRFEPGPRFVEAALEGGYAPRDVWLMAIGQTKPLPGRPVIGLQSVG